MNSIHILWVDDEISYLKPHIIFLEQKNYKITPCNSGSEALELFAEQDFDIVFLDENMPGLSGLETLTELKKQKSNIPVVMITKSEEEYIMEEAIGSKIAVVLPYFSIELGYNDYQRNFRNCWRSGSIE